MIELRPATPSDRDAILAWRNDPETRRAAFTPDEIAPEEHAAWFARKLADPSCAILIAEDGGVPVGQVRVDGLDRARAEIHLVVAPAARGRGYAAEILRRAVTEGPASRVPVVEARVKADNERSLRAFRRAGFVAPGAAVDGVVALERPRG